MSVLNLNKDQFEEEVLKSNLPVIVDFYADWCGPCKMMAPVIEEVSKELEEKVKVAKVNVDENQELAMEYGIMSIPTVLIFDKGEVKTQLVGLRDKNEIKSIIDNL